MGVAVNGAADRARRAGPRLQSGQAVRDRPAHESVDGETCIRANRVRRDLLHVSAAQSHHQALHSGVGNEQIRATAEHGHGDAVCARDANGVAQLARAVHGQQEVRRPADLERRERRERRLTLDARAEPIVDRRVEPGHDSLPGKSALEPVERVEGVRARARHETDPVARRQLARHRQIGRNHRRNLRIAAGRLTVGHQQNRLAGSRHLQRTERRRVREDFGPFAVRQLRTLEPESHAIRLGGDGKGQREQPFERHRCEARLVRARYGPQARAAFRKTQRLKRGLRGNRRCRAADRHEIAGDERASAERSHAC